MKAFDGDYKKYPLHSLGHWENIQYDIYKEQTQDKEYAISNNDTSVKSIYCLLENQKNLVLDGNGASLMFHDRISPFVIDHCENIVIKNFTIDYERPFYTQATILQASHKRIVIKIHDSFPFEIKNKDMVMLGENWENDLHEGIMLFQEFCPKTKTLAYNSPVLIYRIGELAQIDPTSPLPMNILMVEHQEGNKITLSGYFPYEYKVGNELIMTHEKRHNNAFFIQHSQRIFLENIRIVHAGSMGIIAQMSRDLFLEKIDVRLTDTSKGLVSTNCDATHFVHCFGKIQIQNSVFENMMDDGVNIHGIYTKIVEILDSHKMIVEIMHFQQEGILFYEPLDEISITVNQTAEIRRRCTVKMARLITPCRIEIDVLESLKGVEINDFVENITKTPEVIIKNVKIGNNRPRGVLVTTPRKIVIEDCTFYTSGYGIHIAGDNKFWYEAGSVKDLIVQNCQFLDCGYQMGDYAIAITPEFKKTASHFWFHDRVQIINNRFMTFTDGIILAEAVKNLVVSGNEYIQTQTYPKRIQSLPIERK